MRKFLMGAMALLVVGCGGGSSGPRTYTLDAHSYSVPAGVCIDVAGPISVPTAYQDFDILDTPVNLGADSMEVGIISEANFVAAGGCNFNLAIADFPFTGSFSSPAGPLVPADQYDFIVGCDNIVDPCVFNLTWTATY